MTLSLIWHRPFPLPLSLGRYFLDKSVLPTFNSDAIHVNIHRVPGLGEHFINWCDDFFLTAPVEPTDWFKDGKPVVRAWTRAVMRTGVIRVGVCVAVWCG